MRFTSPHRCCLVRSAWLVLGIVSLSLPNLSAAQALKITSNPPARPWNWMEFPRAQRR
jgi:hypothetical protein